MISQSLIVARKELVEHLRDTRSISATVMQASLGPAVVLLVSFSHASQGQTSPTVLLGMLSVFALVTTFTGGMNVAMDATAGERERRSLLPLLTTPVRVPELIVGKWVAASLFAASALLVNLAEVVVLLFFRAPDLLHAQGTVIATWGVLGLLPLALLAAALEVRIACGCSTTKQAHSVLTMAVFGPMCVGLLLVFFPDRVHTWWSFVPIVGQQLLMGTSAGNRDASVHHAAALGLLTLCAVVPFLLSATRVWTGERRVAR